MTHSNEYQTSQPGRPGEKFTRDPLDVSPKLGAAALGAAVGTVVVYAIESITNLDLPTLVEGAITVIFTFGLGYIPKDRLPS
jgi:hypothetical protein